MKENKTLKKLTAILMMITILFTASAFADDLSDRTDPFGFATFADAVKATVEGPVTADCPASVLQLHPDAIVFCDEAAASKLTL